VFLVAVVAACGDSSSADLPTPDATSIPGGLSLVRSGAILHKGDYCHFLQQATPGVNTLPIANGCQFDLTIPQDLFATDRSHFSVSEVVGEAQLGVRGPADGEVMVTCRLSPRTAFWFWVSADGHWGVEQVEDVHQPHELVAAQDSAPLRQYLNVNGVRNVLQFRCAGGKTSHQISLALNMNGHQFTALTLPMPAYDTPLTNPATPWFVDVGARLTSAGELAGVVALVNLYDHE